MNIGWTKEVLRWLYPPRCPVCGNVVSIQGKDIFAKDGKQKNVFVCSECKDGFHRVCPPFCCRCGRTVESQEEFCTNCRGKRFLYRKGFPVWIYDQPVQRSLAAFKYHGRREYAAYYGQEFVKMYGKKLKALSVQALIPVPLYLEKQKIRGYNQAELFAEEIGNRLGICICRDYLLRIRDTVPQKELNDRQRYRNLQRAFVADEAKRSRYARLKNVVLVDDIYTTGSTIELCTEALLQTGIENVYFATVSIGSH